MSNFTKLNSTYINRLQRLRCGVDANVKAMHLTMQYHPPQILRLIGGQSRLGSGLATAGHNDVERLYLEHMSNPHRAVCALESVRRKIAHDTPHLG